MLQCGQPGVVPDLPGAAAAGRGGRLRLPHQDAGAQYPPNRSRSRSGGEEERAGPDGDTAAGKGAAAVEGDFGAAWVGEERSRESEGMAFGGGGGVEAIGKEEKDAMVRARGGRGEWGRL